MSKLAELKSRDTDRQLINDWLDRIGEKDPDIRFEVLDTCAKDIEVRKYFVSMAKGDLV